MTDRTQPDSASTTGSTHIIRYALELGLLWIDGDGRDKVREALDALDTLEAQLEAIGAGGVSGPLMGIAAPPTAQAEAENLRKALQFYADKQHFAISEEDAWDTVSGEPQNYWCDEAGTAMVEDGSIAKMALAGQPINFADEDEDEAAPPTSAEGVEHG